jgi:hypothetical protein
MGKPRLPQSLRRFIEQQTTLAVADLWDDEREEQRSPYGSYLYRAVACILLSGRVQPKYDGTPNRTDVNRVGKEANFNQYLTERIGNFLVAMHVVQVDREGRYEAGPNLDALWDQDVGRLPGITRQAVLDLIQRHTGFQPWRPTTIQHAHLIEFLALFFACFRGRALAEPRAGQIFRDFARLPENDLVRAAHDLGLEPDDGAPGHWQDWLDDKGQKALTTALYEAEWAYYAEREQAGWIFASPVGLGLLGLEAVPPAPDLSTVFRAQPDLSVFAGAGLGWETLVPLFRHATIRRIDQVYEFRLDRKRLAESPSDSDPGEQLRGALRVLEPLPSPVLNLLGTKPKVGGQVGIRWCSALVKPENADVLAAIRSHPRLKGYLEPWAPPGYLLVKSRSDPDNFVRRCRDLGFAVNPL